MATIRETIMDYMDYKFKTILSLKKRSSSIYIEAKRILKSFVIDESM